MRRLARWFNPATRQTGFALVQPDGTLLPVDDPFDPKPLSGTSPIIPDSVRLLAPLPATPSKIIAVGMNYPAHVKEMQHETVPTDPVLFLKAPSAVIGPEDPIIARQAWGRVDYEGELAVVIGAPAKDIPQQDALSVILGYTLANDVTARELQRRDNQWGRAKNFDTFCPLGPVLLLNDGQEPGRFRLITRVDGHVVQQAHVHEMRFSVSFLVSYISAIMTLNPGDIILTGTPQGVAPLTHGQTVEIGIAEIGWLKNPFACDMPNPAQTKEARIQ